MVEQALPPLPEPDVAAGDQHESDPAWFTADQMRAYARQAGLADRQDAERYRLLFTIKDFCRDPLWPVVEWMRGTTDHPKEVIDAALDAAAAIRAQK